MNDQQLPLSGQSSDALSVIGGCSNNSCNKGAVPLGVEDTTDSYDPAQGDDILAPEQSRRLSELFDLRDRRPLTEEEQVELNVLVAA